MLAPLRAARRGRPHSRRAVGRAGRRRRAADGAGRLLARLVDRRPDRRHGGARGTGARAARRRAGIGAVPVDVRALGCDFYAASGQKWLCGPDSSGYLYVRGDRCTELDAPWPSYLTLADTATRSRSTSRTAARFDTGMSPSGSTAWATRRSTCSATRARGGARARNRAGRAAGRHAGRARPQVAPRGPSTLVSWRRTTRRGTSSGSRPTGSSSATCPGAGWCARRSERGRPRRSSSG